MHRCESFRTSVIEPILDGGELTDAQRHELSSCVACTEFYRESVEAIGALSVAFDEPDEEFFGGFNDRLRRNIINDRVAARPETGPEGGFWASILRPLIPAASLMWVVFAVFTAIQPADDSLPEWWDQQLITESILDLDPVTIDFMEQSELFLRTFSKLTVDDVEDLAESQQVSLAQIPNLALRREAAMDFPPVLVVLDEYEDILRDVRNLPEEVSEEDIADIQERIHRTGLVAKMKTYQPNMTLVALER